MSNELQATNSEKIETQNSEFSTKIIGITGGIGSGKSTVAKYIAEKGFSVYESDFWAKELVNHDEDLKQNIISLLGSKAYDENGKYDRKWVSEQVFDHQELLLQLNQLIHPAVRIHFQQWVNAQNGEFVFKETALLFELKLHIDCYKTILVTADENIRIKRVMDRDGRTYREVKEIIDKQMPEQEKIKLADFVIENNGNLSLLQEKTETILLKIAK